MVKPTLLQSLFNQPSQKYAQFRGPSPHRKEHSARVPAHRLNSAPTTFSSSSSAQTRPVLPQLTDSYPSLKISPPLSPAVSHNNDDDFFTPPSSPAAMDSPKITFRPSSSTASSVTEDDIFSAQSATTSATSLSVHPTIRRKSKSRSRPPDWSKDVRWLVPPDHSASSRSSLIQGLDLVDVEYDPVCPKPRPRTKRRQKTRPDRMSALWEEEEDLDETHTLQSSPKNTPMRARTISTSSKRPRPTSILSRSSTISTTRTVSLPTPLPVSSGSVSSRGYTGLTLPRAVYAPSKHPGRVSSSVDITRSGLAQTTMSTIAIARRPHTANTPSRLLAALSTPLSFSAHTSPPNKVHSTQVLVQVWAVGLDALDVLLVEERASRNDGFGYIPGRSFVGRAVECGWDVNNVSKGDWVIGITEVRKVSFLLSSRILKNIDVNTVSSTYRVVHSLNS